MKDSSVNYLVDTGPLVAMLNALDGYHAWSTAALRALGDTFHTTEAVLTETCYLVRQSRPALKVLMDAPDFDPSAPVFPESEWKDTGRWPS